MRLGWTRGVLALLVIAALSVAGAWAGRHLNGGTATPVSVTGTIEATQVDVSVKITGRILERLVKEGDKVSRGQLLVRLDDSELAADVKRQEAALRSAQATLRDLEKGARQQEIEDARAAVSSAEATRSMTEREFQRNDQLFKQNLIAARTSTAPGRPTRWRERRSGARGRSSPSFSKAPAPIRSTPPAGR